MDRQEDQALRKRDNTAFNRIDAVNSDTIDYYLSC